MAGKSPRLGLFVFFLLLGGFAAQARAQGPSGAQLLNYRPKMDGVNYTTPSPQEQAMCKVENVRSSSGKTMGWKVVDGHGQTLRCFLDTTGSGRINIWQYFKDGLEVYREIDTKGKEVPDQFRWLNEGGMKWGIDFNGDGKIDSCGTISSEEVGQEAFLALVTRDFERLQPLFITEGEMRSLRLSDKEIARIKGQLSRAREKFLATAQTVQGGRFKQVEPAIPSCVPGDTLGMDTDLIHFPTRAILYEVNSGKQHTWVQSGEMIQVGSNWRLADAPGETTDIVRPGGEGPTNPLADQILKRIAEKDQGSFTPGSRAEIDRIVERARLIEQLLGAMQPQDPNRVMWYKQLLDNLAAAAPKSQPAMSRLSEFKVQLEKSMPGSDMSGYAHYRELCANFMEKLSKSDLTPAQVKEVQDQWHNALMKFVSMYPKTEDTADALRYLAVGAEFAGRDAEAKRWYEQIYANFPSSALAETARGSVRRLDCVGQPMELTGPMLNGSRNFNISELRGKVVAVYYWASYCGQCPAEFQMLKNLQANLGGKGFEVVCVNLDDEQVLANRFLAQQPAIGIHLFQQSRSNGGLNSPLGTHYGINGLPTLFLIDRQGKVISRTLQVRDLEEALRRAM